MCMKRKLLLLTALVVSALTGMRAQQTPQADGTYYLYNSETGKFLSRGAGFGTAACADNFGIKKWTTTFARVLCSS